MELWESYDFIPAIYTNEPHQQKHAWVVENTKLV